MNQVCCVARSVNNLQSNKKLFFHTDLVFRNQVIQKFPSCTDEYFLKTKKLKIKKHFIDTTYWYLNDKLFKRCVAIILFYFDVILTCLTITLCVNRTFLVSLMVLLHHIIQYTAVQRILCWSVCGHVRERVLLTSQSFRQRKRVHGGPVVGSVLRLLSSLLMQVVHGAEGVHGVQRVTVHPVVLHDGRSIPAEETIGWGWMRCSQLQSQTGRESPFFCFVCSVTDCISLPKALTNRSHEKQISRGLELTPGSNEPRLVGKSDCFLIYLFFC